MKIILSINPWISGLPIRIELIVNAKIQGGVLSLKAKKGPQVSSKAVELESTVDRTFSRKGDEDGNAWSVITASRVSVRNIKQFSSTPRG
jgi:hypothetical protein